MTSRPSRCVRVRGWQGAVLAVAPLLAATSGAVAQGYDRDAYEREGGSWSWSDRAPVDERSGDRYLRDEGPPTYSSGPSDRYEGERYQDDRYAARDVDRADAGVVDADGEAFSALDAYGTWLDHREWGTVWRPNVAGGWRPYSVGRWVNTEDYGWYWDSEEPFGWAVFHYGRWVFDEREGWLWLPGTEWAPAWVAWSHNDDWVGWAPLPPDAIWDEDAGLTVRAGFYEPRFAPWWVFVSPRHLTYPGIHRHMVPHRRNFDVLRVVRPATQYRWHNRRIYNAGIGVRVIERLTGTRIAPTRIVIGRTPHLGGSRGSGSVTMFQPRIAPSQRWSEGRGGSWRQFDGASRRNAAVPTRGATTGRPLRTERAPTWADGQRGAPRVEERRDNPGFSGGQRRREVAPPQQASREPQVQAPAPTARPFMQPATPDAQQGRTARPRGDWRSGGRERAEPVRPPRVEGERSGGSFARRDAVPHSPPQVRQRHIQQPQPQQPQPRPSVATRQAPPQAATPALPQPQPQQAQSRGRGERKGERAHKADPAVEGEPSQRGRRGG